MALRLRRHRGRRAYGVLEAVPACCRPAVATAAVVAAAGWRRVPPFPPRRRRAAGRGPEARSPRFVVQSSVATGVALGADRMLAPLLLGVVRDDGGRFRRVAQAPQSGLSAASSPVRLILLTEQTRDWEHGREHCVLAGVRRYMAAAAG